MGDIHSISSAERIRELLRGYEAGTAEAVIGYLGERKPEQLRRALLGILAFHLPPPRRTVGELAAVPMTTGLEEVGVDSLTLVELGYLLDQLFDLRLPDEELRGVATLIDLESVLKRRLAKV